MKKLERIAPNPTRHHVIRNFIFFSVIASLNHSLTYVVTAYATTTLHHKLGGTVVGITWILNSVSLIFQLVRTNHIFEF
jgi:hypothetical protein